MYCANVFDIPGTLRIENSSNAPSTIRMNKLPCHHRKMFPISVGLSQREFIWKARKLIRLRIYCLWCELFCCWSSATAHIVRRAALLCSNTRPSFRNAGAFMNNTAVDISKMEIFTFSQHFILFSVVESILQGLGKEKTTMKWYPNILQHLV